MLSYTAQNCHELPKVFVQLYFCLAISFNIMRRLLRMPEPIKTESGSPFTAFCFYWFKFPSASPRPTKFADTGSLPNSLAQIDNWPI